MTRTAEPAAAAFLLTVLAAGVAAGQGPGAVRLEVRPRPGDTVHVALVQEVVMDGGGLPRIAETVRVHTRDAITRADARGTEVLAVVDSVQVGRDAPYAPGGARALAVRLHVAPDGATTVHGGLEALHPAVRALFGSAPAVLPAAAVPVGHTWVRELPLPAPAVGAAGTLRVTFRLDSLARDGALAWISLRGRLDGEPRDAMRVRVVGSIVLDRARGWIVRARSELVGSVPAAPGQPPRRLQLTQAMTAKPRG